MKPSVLETMLISTIGEDKVLRNFIVPNFNVNVKTYNEISYMELYTENLPLKEGFYTVGVMLTTDPTPTNAFGSVSLGYFMLRWFMKKAMLVQEKHPIFVCKTKDYENQTLLEMWE